ncbi:MAG: hypothetical protein SCARUB_04255 [Candidatus Scalindua rubra]|uniref:DUF2281 domain-containing protein n=1 Tax=Candidatus Scalindua rubra TaxID=1872076 RepID=A0A1E3X4Q4_9BACT|nr:MAG: hypothetical protein SCARUB_04255 [Candidatus Scalindua rubra]
MQILNAKEKLEEIISSLSESKLEEVIDFACFLRDREEADEQLRMQMNSYAYKDWMSSENDIYDEVFKDEVK